MLRRQDPAPSYFLLGRTTRQDRRGGGTGTDARDARRSPLKKTQRPVMRQLKTGAITMKKITWAMVRAELKAGLYLSYDDYGNKVMRCNNGWIQARTPRDALAFVRGIID